MSRADIFLKRLHEDGAFRQQFATDPAATLRRSGFDPDLLDLPDKIDLGDLETRVAAGIAHEVPHPSDVAEKSAQELWDDFHFIKWRDDGLAGSNITVAVSGPPVTAVIYGTTAVSVTQVGVAVVGSHPVATMMDLERISDLRALSRHGAQQLTFSVSDQQGVIVEGLDTDSLREFLKQTQ